jgi:hypothetical protein
LYPEGLKLNYAKEHGMAAERHLVLLNRENVIRILEIRGRIADMEKDQHTLLCMLQSGQNWKRCEKVDSSLQETLSRKVIIFRKNVGSHSFCLISLGHVGITDV